MSTLSLALIMLVVVVAILVATRPAPRQSRRSDRSASAESEKSPDPLPPRGHAIEIDLTSSMALDRTHRNRWDRHDLAFGVGRDDQAAEPSLLLWPAQAGFRAAAC